MPTPNFKQLIQQLGNKPLSVKQLKFVRDLMDTKNISVSDIIDDGFPSLEKLNQSTGRELIDFLLNEQDSGYEIRDGKMENIKNTSKMRKQIVIK